MTTEKPLTTAEKFEKFHNANPHVYAQMVKAAREWRGATKQRISINSLEERVRWFGVVELRDEDFKLNSNYSPFYARLIMALEPDLVGAFQLRDSQADEWIRELTE